MSLNLLLLTADDMDAGTPGAFGGPAGLTPALDALAADGMTFHRGHVPAAVCQPSRSAIMSGRWPHRNGAEGFEPIRDGVPLLTDVLREAGYLTGILGKVDHLQPVERFGWDYRRGMRELGLGRDPAKYGAASAEFFAEAAAAGRPWFLMANAHDPHRPFAGSLQEREKWSEEERALFPDPSRLVTAEDGIRPPGFLPDLEEVRREYAEYLSSSRRCDDVVGAALTALDEAGGAEDTLVVFISDNGMAFPFAKANCYLRSTLTPLIVRWPGIVAPGRREREAFVSMLDLLPTFCEAAGLPAPEDLDGRSIVPLLSGGEGAGERSEVFTVFHETNAKLRFEMRCVQDARFGYMWNDWADGATEYAAENMEGLSWAAIRRAAGSDGSIAERAAFYLRRAREELYDLANDPDCLRNLADAPELAGTLREMRRRLAKWMEETADPVRGRHAFLLSGEAAG